MKDMEEIWKNTPRIPIEGPIPRGPYSNPGEEVLGKIIEKIIGVVIEKIGKHKKT